jgi:hypothetical protein
MRQTGKKCLRFLVWILSRGIALTSHTNSFPYEPSPIYPMYDVGSMRSVAASPNVGLRQ